MQKQGNMTRMALSGDHTGAHFADCRSPRPSSTLAPSATRLLRLSLGTKERVIDARLPN